MKVHHSCHTNPVLTVDILTKKKTNYIVNDCPSPCLPRRCWPSFLAWWRETMAM